MKQIQDDIKQLNQQINTGNLPSAGNIKVDDTDQEPETRSILAQKMAPNKFDLPSSASLRHDQTRESSAAAHDLDQPPSSLYQAIQ